ncbi:MAG TPA: DegT/DnrJ/EryC1/StrS family aminotransferase, partial [Thermoanaerobaculia bacterium]|nr:DegT/DnrJ/EryC1/StrS family aminotransferase [Thermoanaerobaculia bacterium]
MSSLALFGGTPILRPEEHGRWPALTDDDRRAVLAVLDRGVLSGMHAPEARALERELGEFCGASFCLLTHSGTSALQLALAALGIGEGDEVIVPAYSFIATALAVVLQGAVPIFVDVDPETGGLDPARLAAEITPRTRAVMPVHVHGCPADLDAIGAIARRHGLRLLEDAAQAHGATYRGRPVGALGAAGAFSFQSSKSLAGGEGGLFVTNDRALAEAAENTRSFGQPFPLADAGGYDPERPLDGDRVQESVRVGAMYRGNEMMAALVRSQLRRFPEILARCQENARTLSAALAALPGVRPLEVPEDRTSSCHKFRVRLDPQAAGLDLSPRELRDLMVRALRAEGLEVVFWQTAPLPSQLLFQRLEGFGQGFPWRHEPERARANYDPARY